MSHARARLVRPVFAAAAVLLAPFLVGCSDDPRVSTAPVVQPGRPGEEAVVHPPGTEFEGGGQEEFTEADAAFLVAMIPHHEQALTMAELAPDRAQHRSVLGLAARIADVQEAEIAVYERWLAERGMDASGRPLGDRGHGGHGESAHQHPQPMAGMATEEELTELAASEGADFDRLWLELMIRHHEGAIEMAETRHHDGGVDVRAGELAADVAAGQAAEIRRMETVLAELG